MKALIISDLHLTDAAKEQYRWRVFDWTRQALKEHDCSDLFILGDLFDKKDRHPADIVNRLVNILVELSDNVDITLLQGNHDYLRIESPFLTFLSHLPKIKWINTPTLLAIHGMNTLWLPHSRQPMEEWNINPCIKDDYDMVFMHQSVIGCRVSNYYEMNCGLDLRWLEEQVKCPIISGDIHVPQTIRSLTYVGTPHPVSFGDDYECRALLLNTTSNRNVVEKTWELESLSIPGIKRHSLTISNVDEIKLMFAAGVIRPKDQVKIKILLSPEHFSQWTITKEVVTQWCDYNQIDVFDIKLEKIGTEVSDPTSKKSGGFYLNHPNDLFKRFSEQESIDPKFVTIGQELLTEVLK